MKVRKKNEKLIFVDNDFGKSDNGKCACVSILSLSFAFLHPLIVPIVRFPCTHSLTLCYHQKAIVMENFYEIIKGEGLTLVDFFATWCGPCKTMHPVLERLKEMSGDSVRILKLDVEKNNALVSRYDVRSVPTFLLFKNGDVVWRQSGTLELNDFKLLVDRYL